MAPVSGDLRSAARDAQRVRNHNYKWARGGVPASGKGQCPHLHRHGVCTDCWDKPAQPRSTGGRSSAAYTRGGSPSSQCKDHSSKKSARRDIPGFSASSESSAAEEDAVEGPASAEPDTEVMYSYDAARGPNGGSQILGFAVNQAVERFENKQTEQLAKEYEFVDGKDDYVADADDEDDFEIVDAASFH